MAPLAWHAAGMDKNIVLFDGKCPMCTFQSRLLSRLDWRGRLEMMPIADAYTISPARAGALALVQRADLMNAMHVISLKGTIYRGARAIRFISARLPLLWPLFVLLWIPGTIYISEAVYGLVSRNRYLLSKLFGCKTACAIMPEKNKSK